MLRKILITTVAILLLAVLALVVFLSTFDVNRYRPLVAKRLERVVGNAVRLNHMALGWQNGIALEVKGIRVYPDREAKGDPVLQMDQANATLQLLPLLKKSFQIGSVSLVRPQVHLIRTPQGSLKVLGLNVDTPQAEKSAPLVLLVSRAHVEGGLLRFTDNQTQPPLNFVARDLDLTLKNISWSGEKVHGEVQLRNGTIHLPVVASPIEQITLEVVGDRDRIELKHLSGILAKGKLKGAATIDDPAREPRMRFRFAAERLHLDALQPSKAVGEAQVAGVLDISLEGTAALATIDEVLSGKGRATVSGGRITNVNVLRDVFNKLSLIPGLVSRLENRLSEEYRARLNARDTAFHPVDTLIQLRGRQIFFDQLRLATDDFELSITGSSGFDETIEAQGVLRIHPHLSQAFVRSVNELGSLRDPQGHLQIPVILSGSLGRLKIFPDLKGVATRLAVEKASELLSDWLG